MSTYENDDDVSVCPAPGMPHKLDKIWQSNLPNALKVQTFRTLIEPVLLYGSETWTLTARIERRFDGCYTNLLRRVKNISWREHATLERIYGGLPPISLKLKQKRLQFACHCHRATGEVISSPRSPSLAPTGQSRIQKVNIP